MYINLDVSFIKSNFRRKCMVSDKNIHKAFRSHTTL